MQKRWLLLGLVLIYFINVVYAVGISPPNRVIYFKPWETEKIDFYVVNRGEASINVKVYLNGEFANLTNWGEKTIILQPGEKEDFSFEFKQPTQIDKPGNYVTNIVAQELSSPGQQNSSVSALMSAISPIILRVPYSGPYLKAKVYVGSASVGDNVEFKVFMENLGDVNITSLGGIISIFNSSNETIDEIMFTDFLEKNQRKDRSFYWNSSKFEKGEYRVDLVIYYGKAYTTSTKFKLGDIFVEISNLQKEIVTSSVNEYYAQITSSWDKDIENMFVELGINMNNQTFIYKSENFNLKAWESSKVKIYVDAKGILPGNYNSSFTAFYTDMSNTKHFNISVIKNTKYMIFIMYFVVVFILILFAIFYIFKDLIKKGKK